MISAVAPWTCPTCQQAVATTFCPTCGERRLSRHDLTLVGLFEHIAETLGHVDSRLVRTFRSLVLRPGALTVAYLHGQRKPYIGPFQLFVIANVLFFALQSGTGAHVFSTSLSSHLYQQFYSGIARRLVTARLADLHTTFPVYAPIFDHAVAINAKSFIILMVPPFGLLTLVLFQRTRRPFVVHIVFAMHFFAFVLLLFGLLLPITYPAMQFGLPGVSEEQLDTGLALVQMSVYAIYLYGATRAAFGVGRVACVVAVAVMVPASAAIIIGYRFVVFLITLYTTSL